MSPLKVIDIYKSSYMIEVTEYELQLLRSILCKLPKTVTPELSHLRDKLNVFGLAAKFELIQRASTVYVEEKPADSLEPITKENSNGNQ